MTLDLTQEPESSSAGPARISGNHRPEFSEPTELEAWKPEFWLESVAVIVFGTA